MCLLKFGFLEAFTDQLKDCVTSVYYQVKVNGFLIDSFPSYRGIPLSPYLYILCTEVLSQAVHRALYSQSLRCPLMAPHGNHIPLL